MKHRPRDRPAIAAAAGLLLTLGCGGTPPPGDVAPSPPFSLPADAAGSGWLVLFGGGELDAWRGFREEAVPDGWSIEAGALYCSGRFGTPDLITRQTYGDFELVLEFLTDAPGRNSGILYRVNETNKQTYHSGPEFQILDDAGNPKQRTGANYALHGPTHDAARPSGEWNEARIIARGSSVEHWLNGERIVRYELGTPEWQQLVADSKFARWSDYGRESEGHIALQSHGSPVWFRHIRIRRLAP
jgi:hypothetical protein